MRPFRAEVIEQLREQMARLEEGSARESDAVSTGITALDALLPQHGWRGGDLIEWLGDGPGCGVATLALAAAVPFLERGGPLVVVDAAHSFYPPVLTGLGISLPDTIIVRPRKSADVWWAIEQSLRCPGVAVTFASCARDEGRETRGGGRGTRGDTHLAPLAPHPSLWRRFQLAAEVGGGLGVLVRSAAVRGQPTWAQWRFLVRALPSAASQSSRRQLQVELLYARGCKSGGEALLELVDEAGCLQVMSLASQTGVGRIFAPSRHGDAAPGQTG